jgi:beta-glucosidase
MEHSIKQRIGALTLEEKASLCSGLDFWHTNPVARLGIPAVSMSDGPHGLRKQGKDSDHLGLNGSIPSTCFPPAVTLASSWNKELINRVGEALGRECRAEGVSLLLGPGVNIKRSPLCGRNFEYFSEDPLLSSSLAKAYIEGVQSQGVGTVLKHFAVNNQETRRMTIDVRVDERALHEIYLASFETAIKQAKPWAVMSAYNMINGCYASENNWLLEKRLRQAWQFDGLVISDWGAVNDRVASLSAGLDLDMPGNDGRTRQQVIDAVNLGTLPIEELDQCVARILRLADRASAASGDVAPVDMNAHHALAREAAAESIVLLKNEDECLPLKDGAQVAIIGALSEQIRYQGSGSSRVNPWILDKLQDELERTAGNTRFSYATGYRLDSDQTDPALTQAAIALAAKSDVTVVFIGLPEEYESEGFDRQHLRIPAAQVALLEALARVQDRIVVILSNGAPIEMPWVEIPAAIVECYLGGQAAAGAIADILFGQINPSGKLAETFPQRLEHTPSYLSFPGGTTHVDYAEGLFVGYRYYDTKALKPLFPFGHGLSYTRFDYADLLLSHTHINENDPLDVEIRVSNTGTRRGKEIVQLYVRDSECSLARPLKELKGFEKIELAPGEAKQVRFTLDRRAFAFFHPDIHDWHVESGWFEVLIGRSSQDIVASARVEVTGEPLPPSPIHLNSTIGDVLKQPALAETFLAWLEMLPVKGNILKMFLDEGPQMRELAMQLPLRSQCDYSADAPDSSALMEIIETLNHLIQHKQQQQEDIREPANKSQ